MKSNKKKTLLSPVKKKKRVSVGASIDKLLKKIEFTKYSPASENINSKNPLPVHAGGPDAIDRFNDPYGGDG
jgi:hypothetical protein